MNNCNTGSLISRTSYI